MWIRLFIAIGLATFVWGWGERGNATIARFTGIEASHYKCYDATVSCKNGKGITSIGVEFRNEKRGLCAASFRALETGMFRYGDIVRMRAPNGRTAYCAIVDVGSLYNNGIRNANRHLDLSWGTFVHDLGYPERAGIAQNLEVEVVSRVCGGPPRGYNKCPGYKGNLAQLGEQRVALAAANQPGHSSPTVFAQHLVDSATQSVPGVRAIWQELVKIAQSFNNHNYGDRKQANAQSISSWFALRETVRTLDESISTVRQQSIQLQQLYQSALLTDSLLPYYDTAVSNTEQLADRFRPSNRDNNISQRMIQSLPLF